MKEWGGSIPLLASSYTTILKFKDPGKEMQQYHHVPGLLREYNLKALRWEKQTL